MSTTRSSGRIQPGANTAQTALTLAFDAQEKVLRIRTFLHNIRPLLNQLVTIIPERDASTVPFSTNSGSRLQCQSSNAWNSFRFTTLVLPSILQQHLQPRCLEDRSLPLQKKEKPSLAKAWPLQYTFPNSGSPKCGQMTCTATVGPPRKILTRHP